MTEEFTARYLSGRELWGDDFGPDQIAEWFEDEREAYADLGAAASSAEEYGYSGFNRQYGFRHLPDRRFSRALGVGSSFGGEFMPVLDRVDEITVLEPSARLRSTTLRETPVRYVEPVPSGDMPFADASFDLVLCFGVLHHIPNVSKVVREIGRVTAADGWVLICEPVVSMGDWRGHDRPGLTKRERGIPRHLLEGAVRGAGLAIRSSLFCAATVTPRLGRALRWNPYATRAGSVVDRAFSLATAWNYRYHPVSSWQKLRPSSVFITARREG
ncbi:methyltransferase domain-containing protein [Kitasatospora sp. NPDC048365]|uniref:class I SAM-dependent methyltransferase n=1 Tax=Kitasatospora sp. NPDC048365 TaxID=3364050 RepID=UPI003721F81B